MDAATLAGAVSTILFATSTLPMLVRAARTRDLTSYSRAHLLLTNGGNLVHTWYVLSLPLGPVWFLHGFHLLSTALMLFWHLRHVHPTRTSGDRRVRADEAAEPVLVGVDSVPDGL